MDSKNGETNIKWVRSWERVVQELSIWDRMTKVKPLSSSSSKISILDIRSQGWKREMETLKQLNHPHIPKYLDYFEKVIEKDDSTFGDGIQKGSKSRRYFETESSI